MAEILTKE